MPGGLADIEYLARSERRLVVLQTIVEEMPDRPTLRDRTGIPRQTLTRILGELEDRGWVERVSGDYRATALGSYVAEEFAGVRRRIDDAREVAGVFEDLPDGAAALGIEAFVGSDVVQATPGDPLAPVRRAAVDLRAAETVRVCAGAVTQETLAANLEAVEAGQQFEAVFDPRATEAIRSEATLRSLAEQLLTHDVALFGTDRELTYSVGYADDVVAFGLSDERGAPTTYLRTADERVLAWAESLFEELIADGERLNDEGLDP